MIELPTASPSESARFGLRVARWRGADLDPHALAEAVCSQRLDVVILRLPSALAHNAHALTAYGLHPQYADTLVYYEASLWDAESTPPRNPRSTFEVADTADTQTLETLVRSCFDGYRSHYRINPRFPSGAILDGYVEWAIRHIDGREGNTRTWISRGECGLTAFACCREQDGRDVEIALNGVHPNCSGKGLYGDLIRFIRGHYAASGYSSLRVSTQITNLAVQKVWQREGFHLYESWVTFHLNPLLSVGKPVVEPKTVLAERGAGVQRNCASAAQGDDEA